MARAILLSEVKKEVVVLAVIAPSVSGVSGNVFHLPTCASLTFTVSGQVGVLLLSSPLLAL